MSSLSSCPCNLNFLLVKPYSTNCPSGVQMLASMSWYKALTIDVDREYDERKLESERRCEIGSFLDVWCHDCHVLTSHRTNAVQLPYIILHFLSSAKATATITAVIIIMTSAWLLGLCRTIAKPRDAYALCSPPLLVG